MTKNNQDKMKENSGMNVVCIPVREEEDQDAVPDRETPPPPPVPNGDEVEEEMIDYEDAYDSDYNPILRKREVEPDKDEEMERIEAIRIKAILENQTRRAECGCVIKILASEILDPECYNKMRCQYLYGIISNLEDICEVTTSRAYQINWSFLTCILEILFSHSLLLILSMTSS